MPVSVQTGGDDDYCVLGYKNVFFHGMEDCPGFLLEWDSVGRSGKNCSQCWHKSSITVSVLPSGDLHDVVTAEANLSCNSSSVLNIDYPCGELFMDFWFSMKVTCSPCMEVEEAN